jgi:hypothetical protein
MPRVGAVHIISFGDVCSMFGLPSESGRGANISGHFKCAKTCHGPLPCACESDVALPQSCQRDVPRSYFCGGSGDAVGRHLTQTFNFAVCSHRVPARR